MLSGSRAPHSLVSRDLVRGLLSRAQIEIVISARLEQWWVLRICACGEGFKEFKELTAPALVGRLPAPRRRSSSRQLVTGIHQLQDRHSFHVGSIIFMSIFEGVFCSTLGDSTGMSTAVRLGVYGPRSQNGRIIVSALQANEAPCLPHIRGIWSRDEFNQLYPCRPRQDTVQASIPRMHKSLSKACSRFGLR